MIVAASVATTSCNGDKLRQAENENAELTAQVAEQRAMQDSLLVLFNDISDGMAQIKDLEKIISAPTNLSTESNERKEQIKNDMIAIQQALQERRQRLEQLEAKLSKLGGENKELLRTIDNLKAQIADQQTEIATLTNQLASANIQIKELGTQVTHLNTTVDSLNTGLAAEQQARQQAQEQNAKLDAEANACFYVIGTDKELKAHGIIQKKFLGKTKVMKGDPDMAYFTTADMRTFTVIPTHSKKAEIMSGQPKDSYQIADQNGQKVIQITNPTRFWQMSRYLIIKVD